MYIFSWVLFLFPEVLFLKISPPPLEKIPVSTPDKDYCMLSKPCSCIYTGLYKMDRTFWSHSSLKFCGTSRVAEIFWYAFYTSKGLILNKEGLSHAIMPHVTNVADPEWYWPDPYHRKKLIRPLKKFPLFFFSLNI